MWNSMYIFRLFTYPQTKGKNQKEKAFVCNYICCKVSMEDIKVKQVFA